MTTPTQFVDPMDAVIEKLQPRDTNAPQLLPHDAINPKPEGTPAPVVDPAKPADVVPPTDPVEPAKDPDPKAEPYDIDKEINDLLEMVKKDPKPEVIPEVVKTEPDKKVIKVPKVLEKSDNQELSVDEREEITNYIYDLEEQLANFEFDKKRESVEKSQLEQMLEKERQKNNETFDKLKELEREMKKSKSISFPDELQTLVDYFKLNKDNSTLYNKRNLVGEASKIIEQITEKPMDPYLLDWLKSGSYFNGEAGGANLDMPKAAPEKKTDTYNVLQF